MLKYDQDGGDIAFESVFMSNTQTSGLVYFETTTFELLKAYMDVDETSDLYLKVVAQDDEQVELRVSTAQGGRMSGFYKANLNDTSGQIQLPIDYKGEDHYGKTETVGFLRCVPDDLYSCRVVVRKPPVSSRRPVKGAKKTPEALPVTVTRPAPLLKDVRVPSVLKVLPGFTKMSETVTYRCDFTGSMIEFPNDEVAHRVLAKRSMVAGFCLRHGLKFDPDSAWVKALIDDDSVSL